jgi:chemotaxis protein MotB
MAAPSHIQGEESTEHFFASFTDLLVGVIFIFMLLLMVFALNFKQAESVNAEAAQKVIITEEIRAALLKAIGSRMEARDMPVRIDLSNGVIRLPESLLFASGEWKLSPQGEQVIAALAQVLSEMLPCATSEQSPNDCRDVRKNALLDSVLIEGHTDSRPFASPEGYTNWELSAFRAITVYKALTQAAPALDGSIKNSRGQPILGISAYGERRPVDADALDPNRRIDLRFNMRAPGLPELVITPKG